MQDLTEPQAQVVDPQSFFRVVGKELDQGLPGGRPILVAQDLREILPVEGRRGNGVRRGRRRGVQGQLLRAVGGGYATRGTGGGSGSPRCWNSCTMTAHRSFSSGVK